MFGIFDVRETIEDGYNWLKNTAIQAAGRGLFGLALAVAISFELISTSAFAPLAVTAIGLTVGLQALVTYRKDKYEEQKIVDTYRNEVGAALGIDPKSVTIEQVQEVGRGNIYTGLPANPIIEQAVTRNSYKHLMQFVTTGITAAVTILGVMAFGQGLVGSLGENVQSIREYLNIASGLGGDAQMVALGAGITLVSGTIMNTINRGMDYVGGRITGLNRDTAHDKVRNIRRAREAGKIILPEQVFDVFVCANPGLDHAIEESFGKRYGDLIEINQRRALEQYGGGYPVQELTRQINDREIEPQELAFIVVGQESGVPKQAPQTAPERELSTVQRIREGVKSLGKDKEKTTDTPEETAPVNVANDNVEGFAARFAPKRENPKEQGFAATYASKRDTNQSHMERELERMAQQLAALQER